MSEPPIAREVYNRATLPAEEGYARYPNSLASSRKSAQREAQSPQNWVALNRTNLLHSIISF
jgi:hypothetical protein